MKGLRRVLAGRLLWLALVAVALVAIWYCTPAPHPAAGPIPGLRDRPDAFMGPSPEQAAKATGHDPESIEMP